MDVGQVVAGRYRLTERLGGGGMGVVWQAHDERLRRTVAVKEVLLPPALDESRLEEIRRRTMREGRIAAKLHHPQVIAVYDVIEDDGRPYIVMEYLPSTSLSRVLSERGTLPPQEVARIGAQAAAALASAHAAGVVHRDVKPANILVGDDDTVKLTDFGVSRVVEDVTGTSTGTFVGTPAYLAPEVAQGREVTFAADAYSLGATLYTAVEGGPPAGRSDNAMLLLHRIASGEIVPPKQAGPLTAVLTRLLAADPEQRPTMVEATALLTEVADGRAPAGAAAPVAATTAAMSEQRTEQMPEQQAAPAAAALPTAVAPAAPAPPPVAEPAKPADPKRRRALLAFAALFVLVALTVTLVTLNTDDNPPEENNNAAPPPASESSTSDTTTEEPVTTTSEPPPAEPDPVESSAQAPSTPTKPPNNPPNNPAPQPPANAAAAVTDYYALMPGNPQAGWARLTPRFQQSPAGGWGGYVSYWNSISAVRASQASGQGSVVEVTIDYSFKDGRQVNERHRYGLVNQNGRWLIDTVTVLSSTA